jgi:hypothetical protein
MKLFRRRGTRPAQAVVEPTATDMEDAQDVVGEEAPVVAPGPVPLVLMTRDQIERMNAGTGPSPGSGAGGVVRVRPGRGAFGGTVSSGGGCGPHGFPT